MYAILILIHADGTESPFDSVVYSVADAQTIRQDNPQIRLDLWVGSFDVLAWQIAEYHAHVIS